MPRENRSAVEPTRRRVVVTAVTPEVEGGRFPAKRVTGEEVVVEADVFADGHDEVAAAVRYRPVGGDWSEVRMTHVLNDRWEATFAVTGVGRWEYTVDGWIDRFGTWVHDLGKRVTAGNLTHVDLLIGADLLDEYAAAADDDRDAEALRTTAAVLRDEDRPMDERAAIARDPGIEQAARRQDPRRFATTYERVLEIVVDRPLARFGAWYEVFPRSTAAEPGAHGTLRDVEAWLPYVQDMGFDVLYLPPIHPIGTTARKGKNNTPDPAPDDVGSPWAIGSPEGGHMAVHPQLGTIEDFDHLVAAAADHDLEIALDLAFQCSPDHPWVTKHPEWFRSRPDGTIQYAENPPKKYQDIYPIDFECEAYESLWQALREVVDFWIDHGVRVFRVDNPHTKALPFWEWCIEGVHEEHPEVLFLAEAFTRPKLMYGLAKRGFTQGYTYFTWRRHKWEIEEYFTELSHPPVVDFFRPNAWPNTPDILTDQLQYGGRPMFVTRLVLAATLSANYGIYGPAFELLEHEPLKPGSEEYLHSEKYQIRDWDLAREDSLAPLIARINRIRHEHPALHDLRRLQFHHVDNDALMAYSKSTPDFEDVILVVVNLDPHWRQGGGIHLDVGALGLEDDAAYFVHDLLTDGMYQWHGAHNYVELDPATTPAHVFRVMRLDRDEHDFPYFA